MMLKKLELVGFKSFAKKATFLFDQPITAIVGPNGSGKSNVVEAIKFVLGEQSMKSLRGGSTKDLIFAGSRQVGKMSRAKVEITFANPEKNGQRTFHLSNNDNDKISLDFDEIVLSREIFSDGGSKYAINGIEVRMKDIVETIASVNIGSSGHHIISQGEADRLLNAAPADRKEMIEDALGLKIYQWRIRETERKLEKTRENLKESTLLRREIAPHLKFLQKQVEKIEAGQAMQDELRTLYGEYLHKQRVFIDTQQANFSSEKKTLEADIQKLDKELAEMNKIADVASADTSKELASFEKELHQLAEQKGELSRNLGRVEGMIELAEERGGTEGDATGSVPFKDIEDMAETVLEEIEEALGAETKQDMRVSLVSIRDAIQDLLDAHKGQSTSGKQKTADTSGLEKNKRELEQNIGAIEKKEQTIKEHIVERQKSVADAVAGARREEQERFAVSQERAKKMNQVSLINVREEGLAKLETELKEEITEAKTLVGDWNENWKGSASNINQDEQEILRKKIERLKIKLEDIGGGSGADVVQEYEETRERDEFLAREAEDLQTSMETLNNVLEDLAEKLEREFKTGVEKITKEFQNFFKLMFGGGTAGLKVVVQKKRKKKILDEEGHEIAIDDDEEDQGKKGIEINVSLPRKKIKALDMLSGGERSLTSIALLFALSQVNPPPFLVLDETDAALDEANSQRYGDMIENLAKLSQLIVVTHNRETMSRAHILYGVTIGSDATSQLLSIKLDQAVEIAK